MQQRGGLVLIREELDKSCAHMKRKEGKRKGRETGATVETTTNAMIYLAMFAMFLPLSVQHIKN